METAVALSVSLKELAPCRKELRVEVPLEDVRAAEDQVYKEIKKSATVPGFRVGNAPRDLLEQQYGKKAREETIERLIASSLREALKDRGPLDLVCHPQVTEVAYEPNRPFSYTAILELAPQVALGRYKGLRLTRPKAKVSNEMREAEHSRKQALEQEMTLLLLDSWSFDLPPSVVASQAQRILRQRVMDLMFQGVPPSEIEGRKDLLTDQAKVEALKQVKIFFILRRIAVEEKVGVSPEELEAQIQALAEGMRAPVDQVRKDLEARGAMDDLMWSIMRAKTVELILQQAQIKDAK